MFYVLVQLLMQIRCRGCTRNAPTMASSPYSCPGGSSRWMATQVYGPYHRTSAWHYHCQVFFSPVLQKHSLCLYFLDLHWRQECQYPGTLSLFLFFQNCTGTKDANILALRVSQRVYFSRSALAPGMPISWP